MTSEVAREAGPGRGPSEANGLTGNRARDHLANERSYMAWLRSCLGLAATGALLARTSVASARDKLAVLVSALLGGLLVLSFDTVRYYEVTRDLEQGMFRASRMGPLIIGVLAAVLVVAAPPLPA